MTQSYIMIFEFSKFIENIILTFTCYKVDRFIAGTGKNFGITDIENKSYTWRCRGELV